MKTSLLPGIFSRLLKFFLFFCGFFIWMMTGTPAANAQSGQLLVLVKAGNVPLPGVPVFYSCSWAANLGDWSTWNSGTTDANGQVLTPVGQNLQNVLVEIGYIPWDIQQLYGNTVYPAQYSFLSLTTLDTIEFNLNPSQPQIAVLQPAASVAPGVGDSLFFSASVSIAPPYWIDSVLFTLDGAPFQSAPAAGFIYNSVAAWHPAPPDFYSNHNLQILAYGSNGTSSALNHSFYLDCSGLNCPNQLPVVSWLAPAASAINQPAGFAPINLSLAISDPDGSISSAQLFINGNPATLNFSPPNLYSHTFTPAFYGNYHFTALAVDNTGDTTIFERNLLITNSIHTPLPDKVIVGYWHSWDNSAAPFIYLNEVAASHFNVVVYSFIETLNGDGFTPQLTINTPAYLSGGVFNPQLLKDDIQSLKNLGIPVLVSIGGQNGHVELNTIAEKDTFVQGVIDIVEEYGFDGIDLDFEGSSMNFGAGNLPDFSYASIANGAYPKLKNVIDAFTEIDDYFGPGFHLTAAPELFYVQVGFNTYSSLAGSFLPVIDNLRSRLDYVHVQLYNSGSVVALDNQAYNTGSANFVVAMTDMLLKGFDVAATGIHFDALAQSQVVIGLPACPDAAPAGGYVQPAELTNALNYLVNGQSFGGGYNLQNAVYQNLRGVMTWSVNWDKSPNCGTAWEFSNNAWSFFGSMPADTTPPVAQAQFTNIYLDDNGLASLSPQQINNNSWDNLGIASMSVSQQVFDCEDIGAHFVTLTVFDLAGNSDTAECMVAVADTIAPLITVHDTLLDITNGPVELFPEEVILNAFDNCGTLFLSLSQTSFDSTGIFQVTLMAMDESFNTRNVQFQVTVNQEIGVSEDEEAFDVEIFPNPFFSEDILQVRAGQAITHICLMDAQGRIIFSIIPEFPSPNIQLSPKVSPGIYFLQLSSFSSSYTKKLLINCH